MTNAKGAAIKFTAFACVMVMLTVILFVVFGRYQSRDAHTYSAIFSDVSGLKTGDSVRAGGLQVGNVTAVSMRPDHAITVTFDADRKVAISSATKVAVRYLNLVGDRFLALTDSPGTTHVLEAGSQIPLDRTEPALDLDLLLGGLKPVIRGLDPADVNALTAAVLDIFQGQDGALTSLMSNSAEFSNTISDRSEVVQQLIDSLNEVITTLSDNGTQFAHAIDGLQRLVSGLSEDRDPIGDAIESLENGTSTLVDLLGRTRKPLSGNVQELGRLAPILDDHKDELDYALQRAPGNYRKLVRLGAYGSWLNFYLCELSLRVSDLQNRTVVVPWIRQNNGRCMD